MRTIGANIRYYRCLHHLTQEKLAELADVNEKSISAYENDTRIPPIRKCLNANLYEAALALALTLPDISKSSYCYQANSMRRPDKYSAVRTQIREIFVSSKDTYGYRRVYIELKNRGFAISEKVVKRLMRVDRMNVRQVKVRKYNSYAGEITPAVENIINRDFHADVPNQKWVTDITEFHIPAGQAYRSHSLWIFSMSIFTGIMRDVLRSLLVARVLCSIVVLLASVHNDIQLICKSGGNQFENTRTS